MKVVVGKLVLESIEPKLKKGMNINGSRLCGPDTLVASVSVRIASADGLIQKEMVGEQSDFSTQAYGLRLDWQFCIAKATEHTSQASTACFKARQPSGLSSDTTLRR